MKVAQKLQTESVCLVDEGNTVIGHCPKATVHGYHTPLHRAFSVFLFNQQDQLLVQRRSLNKVTWPGIWSNSCCGHPLPGEETLMAAKRRLQQELYLDKGELYEALPDFRYRSRYLGIEENEICPVYIGRVGEANFFNHEEIEAIDWLPWETFVELTQSLPTDRWGELSPWSKLEATCLQKLGSQRLARISTLPEFTPMNTYEDTI